MRCLQKPPSRADERLKTKKAKEAEHRAIYRKVLKRDGRRCRACGGLADHQAVNLLTRGHIHHIVFRSAGGPTRTENLVLLCGGKCHAAVHAYQLDIEGNADEKLMFRQGGKVWRG